MWIERKTYWEHTGNQGTDDWKEARKGRSNTSDSGIMTNHSIYKTPEEHGKVIAGIKESIFDDKSKELMAYGHKHEPDARKWYETNFNITVTERGLIVPKSDITIGASVDGDIENTDAIIEIKCPKKMYKRLQQHINDLEIGWEPPKDYYGYINKTHLDQMQQAMYVTGKKRCIYIVYCPEENKIFTETVHFLHDYWEENYVVIKENYNKYVRPYLKKGYPIIPS